MELQIFFIKLIRAVTNFVSHEYVHCNCCYWDMGWNRLTCY